ncbi:MULTISPECIES: DUF1295 domain-containing protein [unclassified Streptomyces]|uniref:DUF1295 domain-containing protein n=1 Tax=Streptomyces sp. NBC_00060 TaxID=2975636 RepID=A0AAU2HBD6_9ACTN
MKTRIINFIPFLACWLPLAAIPMTRTFAICNLGIQLAIFIAAASIPGWHTGRLSYVDFAWSFGVFCIGIETAVFAQTFTPQVAAIAGFYLWSGGRMSLLTVRLYTPRLLQRDFPRYIYQRKRWTAEGFRSERLSIQYEIMLQATANASALALPGIIVSTDSASHFGAYETAAVILWATAFGLERIASRQKRTFTQGQNTDTDVCTVGLWRYSRHPNYFFHWLQWVALAALAIPSALASRDQHNGVLAALLVVGLLRTAHLMYYTMVHYTGAVPAEHFSVSKRPAYAEYQMTVNRFFPGPRRRTRVPVRGNHTHRQLHKPEINDALRDLEVPSA